MKFKNEILFPEELKKMNIEYLLKKLHKKSSIKPQKKKLKSGILYDDSYRY